MKPIPYGRQSITQADIEAVIETLQADFLTQGPKIAAFEAAFAKYVGAKYAVAVSNGTAALHLSAKSLGVKPGDKVITSPMTFAATANCVRFCGGEVVFADIDPQTGLLAIDQVKALLEDAPKGTYKGIIPIDYAGYPVDLQAFRELADAYGCWIIEDACHAPGAAILDDQGVWQKCGNGAYADLAIFSFHPVKHIACGEGGMITTNRKDLYEHLLRLRSHGITKDPDLLSQNHGGWYYEIHELAYNYRLTDIQAALGLSQLDRANEALMKRRSLAARYDEAFNGSPVQIIRPGNEAAHAFHLYVIKVPDRKGLYNFLRKKNIYTQVHYIPVHLLPYYRDQGNQPGDFPQTEAFYDQILSIPLFPTLTEEEQTYVIEQILAYYQ